MSRSISFAFGLLSYAIFFATFLYMVGFLSDQVVPKTIDSGEPRSLLLALLVDCGLLLLFGLQHSVMARPAFKQWWTRFVPQPVERSVYVLASSVALMALFALWRPLPGAALWTVSSPVASTILQALFFAGLGLVLFSTFLIDHFDLFGLRQVWLHLLGRPYSHHRFGTPSLYRFVRHPLYVGWLTAMWATPHMSLGHALFAGVNSVYILVAIALEERDLISHFGQVYVAYRKRVPMLFPFGSRRQEALDAEVLAEAP